MSDERQEYNEVSPWWGEHVFRYDVVVHRLKGHETILDIACGSGFGTHKLALATKHQVFGLDVSDQAIKFSQSQFKAENLLYKIGDATKLEFSDNTFDVITSFETIEHTTMYHEMLAELNRVLKPGGFLFISTPNKFVSSPDGKIINPYHTQEFIPKEFHELLTRYFARVELFGQQYARYTGASSNKKFAQQVEKLLYKRGIRKMPIKMQDSIMKKLIKRPIYPQPDEFVLVEYNSTPQYPTLFGICQKIV